MGPFVSDKHQVRQNHLSRWVRPGWGKNRTTDSNRIKNELSDIVRPIIPTFHEQYKQNLELQHENALAKEIWQ